MGKNEKAIRKAKRFTTAIGCLSLLLLLVNALSDSLQEKISRQPAPQKLGNADLLGLLACATRPDQLLAVRPEFYGSDALRVQYLYPVRPGREINLLNMIRPNNWVSLLLHHRDSRYAALFEVAFDGPLSKRTYILLDGANLEMQSGRWIVKNILSGGASTWPEIVNHIDRISTAPLVTIRRVDITRLNAACEFPTRGQTFSAISVSADQSNWKFKDGASEGIPMTAHAGPFSNSDLKKVPSRLVYMNTYGP
jgi:hypothetical protein